LVNFYQTTRHYNPEDSHLPAKDSLGLRARRVYNYNIPCKCGAIYIGEMCHTIEECTKKQQRDLWLYHLECAAMAEHRINQGHRIQFNMMASAKLPHYTSRVIHEAIKVNLHQNINRSQQHWRD
jgi:hypothetical protein